MNPSSPAQTLGWFFGIVALALLGIYLTKKPAPAARNEQLMRRHRRIQERQLGEAYRDEGFICHPLLFFITGIIGAHGVLVIGYATTCAVFGCQEPRY
jgi:hypothetical protein